jgi:chromosome segregation ATPase
MTAQGAAKAKFNAKDLLDQAARVTPRATTTTATVQQTQAEARFKDIASNPYYKVLFNADMRPEEKKAAMTKLLAFSREGTKQENREALANYTQFNEYLSYERQEMAKDIIKLTNTETFSELQKVYGSMNKDLLDFNNDIQPFLDILDALTTLRAEGKTFDAYKNVQNAKTREQEIIKIREEKSKEIDNLQQEIQAKRYDVAAAQNKKSWFGLGGLTAEAQRTIAERQADIEQAVKKLDDIRTEVSNLANSHQQLSAQEMQLAKLLDITTDEHRKKTEQLVQRALNFVNTADTRVTSVRQHLGKMGSQIESLYDNNGKLQEVYTIMNEGIKEAEVINQTTREEFEKQSAATEDSLVKLQFDTKRKEIEQHIATLSDAARETVTVTSDITTEAIRIKTMKDANETQVTKARALQTQGVAGVADRLAVTLQAVTGAALGESSAAIKDTLAAMRDSTNVIAQQEAVRGALGADEASQDVLAAIGELTDYGDTMRAVTDKQRQGIESMRSNLEALMKLSKETATDVAKAAAVTADVIAGGGNVETTTAPVEKEQTANPFAH